MSVNLAATPNQPINAVANREAGKAGTNKWRSGSHNMALVTVTATATGAIDAEQAQDTDARKPITPEVLQLFNRNLELRAMGADDDDAPKHLYDELRAVEKRLAWSLLPRIFGEHWGPHLSA